MFTIPEFATDMIQLQFEEFSEKYSEKIPTGTTIQQILNYLEQNNLLELLVDHDFYGTEKDRTPFFVMKTADGKYEYSESERGGKLIYKTFDHLKDAIRVRIDFTLRNMLYDAPDSQFGDKKYKRI